jgi:hypothetical protein
MFGLSAVSQMMAQDAVFSPPIGRNQQIPSDAGATQARYAGSFDGT